MRKSLLLLGFATLVASQAFLVTSSALAADAGLKQVGGEIQTAPQEPVIAAARGGTPLLSESFTDTTFPPAGWSVYNLDGQVQQWARFTTSFNTTPASASHIWNASVAQNGWLVTPPLAIANGATANLSFVDGGQWMQDYGYSGVMVSNDSCNPTDGDFVQLAEITDTPGSAGTITWRPTALNLNLSAYAGQTICVAFLYQGTDAHRWLIDDVVITAIGGDPEIAVAPASFNFNVDAGDADSDELSISNVGGGTLVWDIELEDATSAVRGVSFDPLLNEQLDVPNFTVVSPANGGTAQQFTIPAGVLTSGAVVGFSFEGTVSGITGNGDWASDMCMQVEGPDGSAYSIGGIGAAIPNCAINSWAFQGGGSTNDGTYASSHANVWPFPPGAQDAGDWTFTFIHGWNSTSANPMNWSNVSVTLHKVGIPEPCDNPGLVSWLSVNPAAGSTNAGATSLVDVLIDTDGLVPGNYSANLCVNSDDTAGNALVVVPVELTVVAGGTPEITVAPASLSGTADEGASTSTTLTIGNVGTAELVWEIDEAPEAEARAHFPQVPRQVGASGGTASLLAQPADPAWLDKMELDVHGLRNQHSRSAARGVGFAVPSYTTTGFSRSDYVTLDALAPGALTPIVAPQPATLFAQTFIGEDFSQHFFIATGGGALAQNAYGFLDTATGAVNQLGVLTGVPATGTWVSASWDQATDTVFAVIVPGAGNNQLFTIDVGTGVGTLVGTINGIDPGGIIIAIAVDGTGLMYGLEIIADVLVAIDKTDATGAVIGPVGVNANFAQDMDFDRSTNTLYWASYLGGGNSNIRTIDTSTGATTVIGPIQDGAELLSFSIALPGGAAGCANPADVPWLSVDVATGTIPAGTPDDVVEVTMDAVALTAGVYNARLCVLSNDPVNPIVEVPVQFTVTEDATAESDLAVSLFGVPDTVNAGGDVSLLATVINFGPDQAEEVSLQVDLPVEFTFVSGRMIEGIGNWSCAAVGQTVTCDLAGTLPIGFADVLQIDVSVDAGADSGTVETFAEVSSLSTDPNGANNVDSTTTTIVGAPADLIFANGFECAAGFPGCATGGTPGFYTDRTTFLDNVQAGFYEEDFANVPVGGAGPLLSFTNGTFSYDVTVVGPGSNDLFNGTGFISTDSALDAIRVTFTGAPVTAIGGNFWATDINFAATGGEIILTLEDGTVQSYSPSSATSFGGFVTVSPIVHITIDSPNVPANNWSTMDNVIVGAR